MKAVMWSVLACSLSACLQSQDVGKFDEAASPCPDPAAATADEERLCIANFIEDLSRRPWAGEATSGVYKAQVMVEFGREGSFRMSNIGDARPFGILFFPAETRVEGRYDITDVLHGEFFGKYEYETESPRPIESSLDRLTVDGDQLTFSWRSETSDLSPITSDLVLTRQR
jgi:hypothetical protein